MNRPNFLRASQRWFIAALICLGCHSLRAADGPDVGAEPGDEIAGPATRLDPMERVFWQALLALRDTNADTQKRGREQLREAADGEFGPAQYYLAESFLRGTSGFARNPRRAVEWYRLAAARGYAPAKAYLGICLGTGTGTRKNAAQAIQWLEAALADAPGFRPSDPPEWFFEQSTAEPVSNPGPTYWETAFALAHAVLAQLHDEAQRPAEALQHFEAAARYGENGRAGINEAARKAAMAYALGRGTTRDLTRANELLAHSRHLAHSQRLASFQNLWSQKEVDDFDLTQLEKTSSAAADEQFQQQLQIVAAALVQENPAEAVKWCELAADAGEAWAMIKLAELLTSGAGGNADPARAFAWYRKAAEEKKSDFAWGNVAACHLRGIGTPADVEAAAAITRAHGKNNFVCMLVTAGLTPPRDFALASWIDLLTTTAKAGQVPAAQYYYADYLLRRPTEELNRLKGVIGRRAADDIKPLLERAAQAGVADAMFALGVVTERGINTRANLPVARTWYEKAERAGSSEAAVTLGRMHIMRGENLSLTTEAIDHFQRALEIDPDMAEAHNGLAVGFERKLELQKNAPEREAWKTAMFDHLASADRLESAYGTYNLGRLHYEGTHVAQDLDAAYEYFQRAAERGHAAANRMLGQMHDRGESVPPTPKDALYYFRLAAVENDVPALREVVRFYMTGRGVALDLERATFWVERLAALGDPRAYITLGDVMLERQDYAEARRLWTRLSRSGNPLLIAAAHERLSRMYRDGLGVKPNPKRATDFFNRALMNGNPEALCRQARTHLDEGHAAMAVPQLQLAAERGSHEASYLLGTLYLAGKGVAPDVARGWELIRKAADAGNAEAAVCLATAALDGSPGAPDVEEAILRAEAAEAAGHPQGRDLREKLEAHRSAPLPGAESKNGGSV